MPLTSYEVLKPISVNSGRSAPWFDQPGGGIQYQLQGESVRDLIDGGFIRRI
jgi:hypothetical protein